MQLTLLTALPARLQYRVRTNEQGEHYSFPIPPRWRIFLPFYWVYWAMLGRPSAARNALHAATERLAVCETASPLGPTGDE